MYVYHGLRHSIWFEKNVDVTMFYAVFFTLVRPSPFQNGKTPIGIQTKHLKTRRPSLSTPLWLRCTIKPQNVSSEWSPLVGRSAVQNSKYVNK